MSAEVSEQKQLCWGCEAAALSASSRGPEEHLETTEVPLAGFGVKAALPLSLVGNSDRMLVSSPTWEEAPGCWSIFFTHI